MQMLRRCRSTSTFDILAPMASTSASMDIHHVAADHGGNYIYPSAPPPPPPSIVDCTLSLGTPSSTRPGRSTASASTVNLNRSSPCSKPSFCWNIIGNNNTASSAGHDEYYCSEPPPQQQPAPTARNLVGGDPLLLARRCASCDTTSTPLWRNGPRGPKSLCNACGIRYKKEERRAAAPTASPAVLSTSTPSAESIVCAAAATHPAWNRYPPAAPTASTKRSTSSWCGPSEDDMVDDVPDFFSWRLNVVAPSQFPDADAHRPSGLFQYQL